MNKSFAEVFVRSWPSTIPMIVDRMKALGMDEAQVKMMENWETILPAVVRATDPECYSGDLHTVLHGDLWLNNLMFKNEGEKDVLFVRFKGNWSV